MRLLNDKNKDRQLENKPYILVEDTQKALQDLAKYYLDKVAPKVVGITGSNGKTTTKSGMSQKAMYLQNGMMNLK